MPAARGRCSACSSSAGAAPARPRVARVAIGAAYPGRTGRADPAAVCGGLRAAASPLAPRGGRDVAAMVGWGRFCLPPATGRAALRGDGGASSMRPVPRCCSPSMHCTPAGGRPSSPRCFCWKATSWIGMGVCSRSGIFPALPATGRDRRPPAACRWHVPARPPPCAGSRRGSAATCMGSRSFRVRPRPVSRTRSCPRRNGRRSRRRTASSPTRSSGPAARTRHCARPTRTAPGWAGSRACRCRILVRPLVPRTRCGRCWIAADICPTRLPGQTASASCAYRR